MLIEDKELRIIDTAGDKQYHQFLEDWINQADFFMLVFAFDDSKSLIELEYYYYKVIEGLGKKDLPIIVVGNKKDVFDKKVSAEKAEEFAKRIGAKYMETCALDEYDVEVMFKGFLSIVKEEGNYCRCNIC